MIKRILPCFLLFFYIFHPAIAQNRLLDFSANRSNNQSDLAVVRSVRDDGLKGMQVNYKFPAASVYDKAAAGRNFQVLNIKDFTILKEVGKPAMPAHYDLVLIPDGADIIISTEKLKTKTFENFLVYPALKPATDRVGDPEPTFEIDEQFYQSDVTYPDQPVKIVNTLHLRGLNIAVIRVCPIQYNPFLRKITVYPEIIYQVRFSHSAKFFNAADYSKHFLETLPNFILNSESVKQATSAALNKKSINGPAVDYIIITHSNYKEAADSLARWKAQLGYSVEVVSRSSWTSSQVKSEIQQRYQNWNPKPDYFVIIGDHNLVPGEIHQDPTYGDNFATDLYYACMDGTGDYVADMAFGRISVSSDTEAMNVVRKIIRYEKNPPAQAAFYNSAVICAMFQDDDSNTYEDRRFSLTAEEIRNYMYSQQGFNIDRVYKTDNNITPLYWNNGTYANSEPVPAYLRKPTFAWDGDKYDIRDYINSPAGRLFVLHRDHGYSDGTGWGTPEFLTNDIDMLNNGNRTPVVFSINCNTGEFQRPECFSEHFLRYTNGGAVGVFGAAYYSYSGYNDGLALGMIDAIWANPGLIPNFTGNGDSPIGSPSAHNPIYTMGDVMNQGLIRMIQTWGDDIDTHELFHYFGDPAMQIWTAIPVAVTTTHTDSLFCHDTVFHVYSSSLPDGLATLVAEGQLIAEVTLVGGTGTLHFSDFNGSDAVLTISKHNYQPYVSVIPVGGDCVKAHFYSSYNNICVGENIVFNNTSSGNILSYSWNFGSGAVPATANTAGPHTVNYTSAGTKTITLTVTGIADTSSVSEQLTMPQTCTYNMFANGDIQIGGCNGVLYDNGGSTGNYANNTNDTAVITAAGASSILLSFNDFDVEPGSGTTCNYDLLNIYDGPSTASPLLGNWCNTSGHTPPPTLTTSGSSFTLVFHADGGLNLRGFEIEWACSSPNSPPNTNFVGSPLVTCKGDVTFTDLSLNAPASWHWDFGDGDTSNAQHPMHIFTQNGTFTISLTATNSHGSNTYVRTNYILIDRPEAPATDTGMVCNSGSVTLHASGSGNLAWYNAPTSGNLLTLGASYTTPVVSANTTYFVEDRTSDTYYVPPADNNFGSGGYYTSTNNRYLIFDALTDITLVSVKVYAQNSKDRTIELRNSSGILLYDTIVYITAGMSRVYLNYPVATGTAYRLVCLAPNNQLYRQTAGASYPYTVSNIVSITGTPVDQQSYYYFYDWEVQGPPCISPRAEATVFVNTAAPTAAFSFTQNMNTLNFTDLSSGAVTYNWDFDDGNFSSIQNPSNFYNSNGTYYVTLNVTNGCGTDSYVDTVYVYTTGMDETEKNILQIYPNPSDGLINLIVTGDYKSDVLIKITDITGRLVHKQANKTNGSGKINLDISSLNSGLYLLRVNDGTHQWVERIIRY